jgi:hypothetical protein
MECQRVIFPRLKVHSEVFALGEKAAPVSVALPTSGPRHSKSSTIKLVTNASLLEPAQLAAVSAIVMSHLMNFTVMLFLLILLK